jgi:FkbH-like protein
MFQLDWAKKSFWQQEAQPRPPRPSALRAEDIRRTSLLLWEEHCHECAPPQCYESCALYVARADRKCARFAYGIYPNPHFSGLFDFGADISFRRWAKLETPLYGKDVRVRWHRSLHRLDRAVAQIVNFISDVLQPLNPKRRLNGALIFVRNYLLAKFFSGKPVAGYDAFVMECFSPECEPFRLILGHRAGGYTLRHAFEIMPGWNLHTLPAERFKLDCPGLISLSPDNSAEHRLIFTWVDFVRYQPGRRASVPEAEGKRLMPAGKVKCVAWDLDNTLWTGVMAEDGENGLQPRSDALDLIKRLDERGILQTVVSKNNFADAWAVIERLELRDYFLYPAINWRPKSDNLKEVAEKLNINTDTLALIDDSSFERAEVQTALPQVRVYSIEQMPALLTLPEFDVPVTEASKKRRLSYLTEVKRERERETFSGDYEAFLRSCEMKLRVFVPHEPRHLQRCLELIQRANQLNMSNRRYTAEEFNELLSTPGTLCLAMDCRDRFGEYGIVGFARVDETGQKPMVRDMVLSCRVAQKRVEHTFLEWLAGREAARGLSALQADLVRTERNTPLLQVFRDLHFKLLAQEGAHQLMELPLDAPVAPAKVVALEAEVAAR